MTENKYVDELGGNFGSVNCEFCSDPIKDGEGRRRIGGKDYHFDAFSDCFMESVKGKAKDPAVIEKCAESMLFDKRVVA